MPRPGPTRVARVFKPRQAARVSPGGRGHVDISISIKVAGDRLDLDVAVDLGQARELLPHDRGLESALVRQRDVLEVAATGQADYGMAAVGEGKGSPGSRLLLKAADRDHEKPLWISVWGGVNTLAQALFDARKERAEGTTGRDAGIAARQTQKAQEALLEARQKVEILTPVSITLPDVSPVTGKQILRVSNLTIRIEGRALFQPVSFSLFGADRLAISGPNGVGKSSLLKAVLDEVNTFEGQIERFGSQFSYLDQHVSLLDTDLSLIDNLRRHCPHLNDNQAHAALARFGFRNSDAEKPVFVLSGGERMRAGLACVLSKAVLPDLLILDEPTNHLDLDTLETLETALKGFGGSLLLVSHDLHFIRAIGCENSIELKQTGAEQI